MLLVAAVPEAAVAALTHDRRVRSHVDDVVRTWTEEKNDRILQGVQQWGCRGSVHSPERQHFIFNAAVVCLFSNTTGKLLTQLARTFVCLTDPASSCITRHIVPFSKSLGVGGPHLRAQVLFPRQQTQPDLRKRLQVCDYEYGKLTFVAHIYKRYCIAKPLTVPFIFAKF